MSDYDAINFLEIQVDIIKNLKEQQVLLEGWNCISQANKMQEVINELLSDLPNKIQSELDKEDNDEDSKEDIGSDLRTEL